MNVVASLPEPRERCYVEGCRNPPRFFGLYGNSDFNLCREHFPLHKGAMYPRSPVAMEALQALMAPLIGPPRALHDERENRRAAIAKRAARLGLTREPEETDQAFEVRVSVQEMKAERVRFLKSREFLMSYEWRKLRMEVLRASDARCQCCGAGPRNGALLNVDHIKPRATHPELALDIKNLQVLCEACNHGKGNWDTTDWRGERR